MTDPEIKRSNERFKMVAGGLFNSGTALAAATVVKLYTAASFDVSLAIWSIGAATLIWTGWLVLGLLDRRTEMIMLPPWLAELSPAIGAFIFAGGMWGLAMYTKRHAHDRSK